MTENELKGITAYVNTGLAWEKAMGLIVTPLQATAPLVTRLVAEYTAQAARIAELEAENADQAARIDDLKSEIRRLEIEIGSLENRPPPSLSTAEMIERLRGSGHLIVEWRDLDSWHYVGGACPLCAQVSP